MQRPLFFLPCAQGGGQHGPKGYFTETWSEYQILPAHLSPQSTTSGFPIWGRKVAQKNLLKLPFHAPIEVKPDGVLTEALLFEVNGEAAEEEVSEEI